MSYLAKRKFVLGPALAKKRGIEEKTTEAKQVAQIESTRLKDVSILRKEAEQKLLEYQAEVNGLAETAEGDLSQIYLLYSRSIEVLQQAGQAVDQYLIVLKRLNELVGKEIEKVREVKKQRDVHIIAISSEDKRLEDKRSDIDIYEKRLRKKIEDAGMEEEIKLVFNE